MKALTLTQPWASLVAIGAKRIETRSWSTSYRGPLAIHAAKGLGPVGGMRGLVDLVRQDVFWNALISLRPSVFNVEGLAKRALPFGAIVAVCELVDCLPIKIYSIGDSAINGASYPIPTEPERSFGDYSVGRFAWLLADIHTLPEPIPAKGALGLWEYEGVL